MSPVRVDIPHALPDPFFIRRPEGWYLTGTDCNASSSAPIFPLYFSSDLVGWTCAGRLLIPPTYTGSDNANFWAPEILACGDRFYLYYTADSGRDPYRRFVRVATAEALSGPYRDIGPLTREPSIDGHPFRASDGRLYLFYTGNEGNAHPGQLLVDALSAPAQAAHAPCLVFPDEAVEWEEGPFLLQYGKRLLLFSSAGNWRDGSYHIRLAQSSHPLGPFQRLTDGHTTLRLLASNTLLTGPGHCCLFEGPLGEVRIGFHAWDAAHTGRYAWHDDLFQIACLPKGAMLDDLYPTTGACRCDAPVSL